jgi:ATP-dependent RNA helicase DDX56/DBP9
VLSLVLDEADLVLSYGHEADVRAVVRRLARGYQGWLVSATLPPALAALKAAPPPEEPSP